MINRKNGAISLKKWIATDFKQVDYRVAIPSYKRAETLKNKTLRVLEESNVPTDKIDIFVANEEEREIYERTLKKGTYSKIIVGIVGMRAIRNFIQDYYNEGDYIVNLDDDIMDICEYKDEKTLEKLTMLNEFFCYAFTFANEIGATYWGVYAVSNPYFMGNSISCGLRYLLGGFWGTKTNHDKRTYVTLDDKEDFERSIRAYLKDGTVARFDFITYKTNCYTEAGGMQVERTEERVQKSGLILMSMFPNQCVRNPIRKKHFEVKLQEQRKDFKQIASIKLNILKDY